MDTSVCNSEYGYIRPIGSVITEPGKYLWGMYGPTEHTESTERTGLILIKEDGRKHEPKFGGFKERGSFYYTIYSSETH